MNKKTNLISFTIMIVILMCSSCNISSYQKQLEYIDNISDTLPDSAFVLLINIDKEMLNKDLTMFYNLLEIKIKSSINENISADSLKINDLKDFYISKGNNKFISSAFFYSGCINLDINNNDSAILDFLEAISYA